MPPESPWPIAARVCDDARLHDAPESQFDAAGSSGSSAPSSSSRWHSEEPERPTERRRRRRRPSGPRSRFARRTGGGGWSLLSPARRRSSGASSGRTSTSASTRRSGRRRGRPSRRSSARSPHRCAARHRSLPLRAASSRPGAGRTAARLALLALARRPGRLPRRPGAPARRPICRRFTPQTSAYASIYYMLLGADHAHVALGTPLRCLAARAAGGRLTRYRLVALEAVTLYWHFVVGMTVVVPAGDLGEAMTRRLSAAAVVRAPRGAARWVAQLASATTSRRRTARQPAGQSSWSPAEIAVTAAAALSRARPRRGGRCLSPSCGASAATRAGPPGRLRLFAIGALVGNALFLVAILLGGITIVATQSCRQA